MTIKLSKTEKLTNIVSQFVSIVGKGANGRSKWLVAKSDAPLLDVAKSEEEITKAQGIRSERYEIPVLKTAETTEGLVNENDYGDPVNLLYPLNDIKKALEDYDAKQYETEMVATRIAQKAMEEKQHIEKNSDVYTSLPEDLTKKIDEHNALLEKKEEPASPKRVNLGKLLKRNNGNAESTVAKMRLKLQRPSDKQFNKSGG